MAQGLEEPAHPYKRNSKGDDNNDTLCPTQVVNPPHRCGFCQIRTYAD